MTRTYTYQWQREVADAWGDVSGATSKDYTPVAADIGYPLRLRVLPSDGAYPAYSNETDPVTYAQGVLLQIEFATDKAAPMTEYAGEAGSLNVVDSTGLVSVTGGEMLTSGVAAGSGDPAAYSPHGLARRAGRALRLRFAAANDGGTTSSPFFGWLNSIGGTPVIGGSVVYGLRGSGTGLWGQTPGSTPATPSSITAGTYDIYDFVLRSTGHFIFQNGALIWVHPLGSDATMYPGWAAVSAGTRGWLCDYARVRDVGGEFASDYGIAALHQSAPSGDYAAGEADAIFHLLGVSLPGAPSALQRAAELRYNVADADNYNVAYLRRNAGNTAWDFRLDTVAAAVATNRLNVTGVGTPDGIFVVHNGNLHDAYTIASTVITKRGAQVNNSNQAASTGVNATFSDGSASFFDVYPLTSSDYDVLDD